MARAKASRQWDFSALPWVTQSPRGDDTGDEIEGDIVMVEGVVVVEDDGVMVMLRRRMFRSGEVSIRSCLRPISRLPGATSLTSSNLLLGTTNNPDAHQNRQTY